MTVSELALQEYDNRNLNIRPLYPAVLLRVLPRKANTGLIGLNGQAIITTDKDQTIREAIVLRTYAPYTVKINDKLITITSGVKPGDHILFPHWSGEPVPWLSDDEYRLIPERGYVGKNGAKDAGEILLIADYEKESIDNFLSQILSSVYEEGYSDGQILDHDITGIRLIVNKIKEEFDIIPKIKTNVL